MDPLSISASIAGLLTAASQVSSFIGLILQTNRTGSKEIKEIRVTVDALRSVLQQLQSLLLSRANVNPQRASLILIDYCVSFLAHEEKLGFLDSFRWASKTSELRRYLRSLEAHKLSLTLMMSILTCESVQNAESAVGELKTILLRVLKNQEMLAERVYTIEGSASLSELTRGDKESISIHSQRMNQVAIGAVRPDIRDETTVNGPIRYTFEEDLQHSWVYQRSVIRGSVAFSIGASTQGTQSWSVLSGLSLSAVSNIAVYALPVYESDLKNSDLYYFGVADKDTAIKQDGSPAPLRISPTPPIASLGRQIRLPVSKSFSLPFNNFNITTKSPGLNRTDGNRPVISEPALVHTTLTSFTDIRVTTKTLKSNCNHGERPVISEPPLIRPILPSFKDINVVDLTTRAPTPDSAGWQNVRLRPGFKGTIVRAPSFSGYEADVEDNWHETHEVQEFRRKRVKNWVEQRTHSLKV